jgi:hypothetical protein
MESNWSDSGPKSSRLHCKTLIKELIKVHSKPPLFVPYKEKERKYKCSFCSPDVKRRNCHEEDGRAGRVNVVI